MLAHACEVPEGVSVGAVVLLDEDCCSATLLELLLLMETPETTLDQDGCQGHPLIKCILRHGRTACFKPPHCVCVTLSVNAQTNDGANSLDIHVVIHGVCAGVIGHRMSWPHMASSGTH